MPTKKHPTKPKSAGKKVKTKPAPRRAAKRPAPKRPSPKRPAPKKAAVKRSAGSTARSGSTRRPVAVVKIGGDVLQHAAQRDGLGANVRDLSALGFDIVIVHGGGPQATALQEQLGVPTHKVAGRRVTSPDDLRIVIQAVCGEVNVGLTQTLLKAGVRAFGCHGASGALIEAEKRPPRVVAGHGETPIDFGEVGDVIAVDEVLLRGLIHLGVVPVVATLGIDSLNGRIFNINADTVAVEVARALDAQLLLMVTAVGGVRTRVDDPTSRVGLLTAEHARQLLSDGTITGGMIPKVEEALSVLDAGVEATAIVDAASEGAFASVAKSDGRVGTRFAAR